MPGVLEKGINIDFDYSYPEPAQVPLGEKPKVWREKLVKGIQQISPVTSGASERGIAQTG